MKQSINRDQRASHTQGFLTMVLRRSWLVCERELLKLGCLGKGYERFQAVGWKRHCTVP